MKRYLVYFIAALFIFSSCEEPEPVYVESEPVVLDQLTSSSATMLSATDFVLTSTFTAEGYNVELSICNKGLTLATGIYTLKSETESVGDCVVSVNGEKVTSGSVIVRDGASGYSLEFKLAGKSSYTFKYDGPIVYSFEVTPSSNTFFMMEGDVTTMNENWQTVIVPGVTKYTIYIVNNKGKDIACLELVGKPGLTVPELTGTYTARSSFSEGTLTAGSYSWWGGSGSWYTDGNGTVQYISGGTITISSITGADGVDYYSLTGKNLTLISNNGTKGSGDIDHRFVKEKPLLGKGGAQSCHRQQIQES